jgi:hypothetical protein
MKRLRNSGARGLAVLDGGIAGSGREAPIPGFELAADFDWSAVSLLELEVPAEPEHGELLRDSDGRLRTYSSEQQAARWYREFGFGVGTVVEVVEGRDGTGIDPFTGIGVVHGMHPYTGLPILWTSRGTPTVHPADIRIVAWAGPVWDPNKQFLPKGSELPRRAEARSASLAA